MTDATNTSADLTDQFERQYAAGWRPAIHEVIQGNIIELSERAGYDEELYPIVVIRTDTDEERAVHAFHFVLRSKLAELEPVVGDRIAIRYDGKIQSKTPGHKPYHGYQVVLERGATATPPEQDDESVPF